MSSNLSKQDAKKAKQQEENLKWEKRKKRSALLKKVVIYSFIGLLVLSTVASAVAGLL